MIDNVKGVIKSVTDIGVALLALSIVASLLVGQANMAFLGDVPGNIVNLVTSLGAAGLAGLITLAVILFIFNRD
jgi:hypothetical protein